MQEADWLKIKQTWLALGPGRDLRVLQRHVQHNYRIKMPLDELRIEANKRGWTAATIEFDSKLNQKIDALTVDNLAKELAAERINGYRKLREQANQFSDILSVMLPKVKAFVDSAKTISLDDARKFMETALKVREFMDSQEVPLLPQGDESLNGVNFSNPAELGRALISASEIKGISIADLEGLKEPAHGG